MTIYASQSDDNDQAAGQEQRRRYFRLSYPASSRLPFNTGGNRPYLVLEISEKSLLIEQKPNELLRKGDILAGDVVFHDMSSEHVSGEVFRHDARGIVITLSKGISLRHVISEQVYVKSKFPLFFVENQQHKQG